MTPEAGLGLLEMRQVATLRQDDQCGIVNAFLIGLPMLARHERVLPQCGHLPHLEQPEAGLGAILDYLARPAR